MKPSQLNKLDISRIRYHKWMYQQFIDITSQCVIKVYIKGLQSVVLHCYRYVISMLNRQVAELS